MDLEQFKKKTTMQELKIDLATLNKCVVFLDFGNINYWYKNDDRDENNAIFPSKFKLSIDIEKLCVFAKYFADEVRFYYGHDPNNKASLKFLGKAKYVFGDRKVFTKEIQQIRHYLRISEFNSNTRLVKEDSKGVFICLPKCNFDVEITIDAVRLMNKYDTIIFFSSDADFVCLLQYLKEGGKKIVLVKSGHVSHKLICVADLVINAQNIKKYIACKKAKI